MHRVYTRVGSTLKFQGSGLSLIAVRLEIYEDETCVVGHNKLSQLVSKCHGRALTRGETFDVDRSVKTHRPSRLLVK